MEASSATLPSREDICDGDLGLPRFGVVCGARFRLLDWELNADGTAPSPPVGVGLPEEFKERLVESFFRDFSL